MVAALYRRYRPESFSEMIGQSQVTEPLMTALRTGRIGHAYLFSGPRGCGKTTSARILARCLNCAEGPTDTPCGVCPSCVELSRDGGGSLDVVEIDAASHGGVDDARDLRERAVFAPARDRFKIFIIDEAHMVTAGGFNALLKIVEEPPPHVKFVFATTEPDKVIGTIRSRTHHYPFRLIAPGTLIDYVQSLCDSEGVNVEAGVLPLVVRAGGGSVRDTLSILDQLIAGSEGDTVTLDRASGLLGFTHTELIDDVVTALGAHDPAAAFRATDRVVQTGQDPRRFVEDLLERLRDLIVVGATTVDGAAAVFRGVPQDQLTRMFEQAQAFGRGELSRIADTVSAALDKMAGATAPRLQLELMIARALLIGPVAGAEAQAAVRAAAPQSSGAAGPQGGQNAGAVGGAAGQGSTGPAQRQAPAQPPAAKPDPLAALAAARGAVAATPSAARPNDAPAAVSNAAPASSREVQTPPNAASASSPNAAETAASIRDFLREDAAGAAGGASGAPETTGEPGTPGSADASHASGSVPSAPSGPAAADSGEPHPNAGAAAFGRPITDVLSNAQVAGMGRESAFQAPREEPRSASAATQQPASPPQSASASSQGTPSQSMSPQPAEQPGAAPGSAPAPAPAPVSATAAESASASAGDAAQQTQSISGDVSAASAAAGPDDEIGSEIGAEAEPGGFEDLVELWPELLEEILQSDRDAWNAVRNVQPLGLDGEVLTVGLASESDLAAFKTTGAGPLRETINSAIGVNVKYVPKRIAPGSAPREAATAQQAGPGRSADTEEPHRGGPSAPSQHRPDSNAAPVSAAGTAPARSTAPASSSSSPAPEPSTSGGASRVADADDPVLRRAEARLSALGPALAAPAWAGPLPEEPAAEKPAAKGSAAEGNTTGPQPAAPGRVPQPETSTERAAAQSAAPGHETGGDGSATATPPATAERQAVEADPSPAAPSAAAQRSASAQEQPQAQAQPSSQSQGPAQTRGSAQGIASAPAQAPARIATSKPRPGPAQPEPDYYPDDYGNDPYDDPYGDGDPYAGADPYLAPAADQASPAQPAGAPAPAAPETPDASATPAAAATPVASEKPAADATAAAAAKPTVPETVVGSAQATASQSSAAPGAPAAPESPAVPGQQSAPDAPAASETPAPAEPAKRSAPAFTRYGEAVVREVLGARFIEERPLPNRLEA